MTTKTKKTATEVVANEAAEAVLENEVAEQVQPKRLSKAEQMAAFASHFNDELIAIPNVGTLELYVQTSTLAQYRENLTKLAGYQSKFGNPLLEERGIALELFDADGNLYFNPENDEDMEFIKALPTGVRMRIANAVDHVNGGFEIPKTFAATVSA